MSKRKNFIEQLQDSLSKPKPQPKGLVEQLQDSLSKNLREDYPTKNIFADLTRLVNLERELNDVEPNEIETANEFAIDGIPTVEQMKEVYISSFFEVFFEKMDESTRNEFYDAIDKVYRRRMKI
jgi:hypothetical protein